MIKNTSVVALLTGRGNNTLQDKNVIDILGHPVLYYPAMAAKNSKLVSYWYCSSDDEKILDAARQIGYISIHRPAELALPSAQHSDTIYHALHLLHEQSIFPDICVVLLANNITIKSAWINDCIQMMIDSPTLSAVVPVYLDNDHHPLRAKTINTDGLLEMYEKNVKETVSSNRQDLSKCYFLSHNFWVLNVKQLMKGDVGQPPWTFLGNAVAPYIIEESIDIHCESDLILAKEWIKKNYSESQNRQV